ncbi:MAG: helix-turn-helix domain-containing protein [Candidatus Omnitrophota bacterium]
MSEKLLTVREVAQILHITEKEVLDLSENGALPAYKIAGVYLRYKQDQVESYKKAHFLENKHKILPKLTISDKFKDFIYFNDFYIICGVVIIIMLYIILKG